jgi:single-stranded DNA-binding protein
MTIETAFFGTLGRDGEEKTSKAGKSYLRLNVRAGDGETAQWIGVMAFDESAIEAAEKFVKGARVYVEGRLSINEWTGQDGAQRHGLSVLSWHCRLAQIGRNKTPVPRQRKDRPEAADVSAASAGTFNDEIGF